MSISSVSSTANEAGDGVIGDETILLPPGGGPVEPPPLISSLCLLAGTPKVQPYYWKKITKMLGSLIPWTLGAGCGVGIFIGSPAFLCLIHSSIKAFS